MKFNINICVIPECYIDTNLIETIVPPDRVGNIYGYNHQLGCNKVVDEMQRKLKDNFAVGILDDDKRKLSRTSEFVLHIEKQRLKLYKHPQKDHYLIFHPPIEQWIIDEAAYVNISLNDPGYNLPTTLKELINETKVNVRSKNDQRFKRLFRDLQKQNALGINLLANWTRYLKKYQDKSDILELKNL